MEVLELEYLIEYTCSRCEHRIFIDSKDGVAPVHAPPTTHMKTELHVGTFICGEYKESRTLKEISTTPDFPLSGVDSKEERSHFTVPTGILRCFACKMPMSRPLVPESHLPDCWFREVIGRLNPIEETTDV